MTFQKTVNRQYTQGWVGEISNDGPVRAKPGVISPNGTAPNRIGRAFTFTSDVSQGGTTHVAIEAVVSVGGVNPFYGILSIPKHYTLFGNPVDGPLGPTYDLPNYTEGEFVDMGIMNLSVSNGNDAAAAFPYGLPVYYAAATAAATAGYVAVNANDLGRLYVFPTAAPVDAAVFKQVPRSLITTALSSPVAPATPNPVGVTATDAGAQIVRVQQTN